MSRILICVSDTQLFLMLRHVLALEGLDAVLLTEPAEIVSSIAEMPLTALMIDWFDPVIDAEVIARVVRSSSPHTAVIVLFRGLDGKERPHPACDLLLTRPFNPEALLDFLHARAGGHRVAPRPVRNGTILRFANLEMNLATMTARLAGRPIYLTALQFRLLRRLLQAQSNICDRDDLIRNCWPKDAVVEPRTVDIHIGHLRRALSDKGPGMIHTIRGRGYALRLPCSKE